MRSVRCLTSLSRAPQDFDYCPCGRAPELQFVFRLTAPNSVFNIIKVLPNHIHRPVTMSVDDASSGDPGDPVHEERIGAESLRQVNLTIMHEEVGSQGDRHFLRPSRRARPKRKPIFDAVLLDGGADVVFFTSCIVRPSRNSTSVQSPLGTPAFVRLASRRVLSASAFARSCSVTDGSLRTARSRCSFR
jgi:hypothetical protein